MNTVFKRMILVLNADYTPIVVTNLKKAFKLVYKGKAEVVVAQENPILAGKKYIRPSIIRLFKYVVFPYKKVSLSRHNIFKRDDFKCLYCGSRDNLTLDHVIPRSRGGSNSWTNLATCCNRCNVLKSDKTPEEANMNLSYKPFTPNFLFFIKKMNKISEEWRPYLMMD